MRGFEEIREREWHVGIILPGIFGIAGAFTEDRPEGMQNRKYPSGVDCTAIFRQVF